MCNAIALMAHYSDNIYFPIGPKASWSDRLLSQEQTPNISRALISIIPKLQLSEKVPTQNPFI